MDFLRHGYNSLTHFHCFSLTHLSVDTREIFGDFEDARAEPRRTDSEELSVCAAVLGEGEAGEDSDAEFLDRTFRATQDEAEVVMGAIRNSIDANRFATYASLRNGVVTVQWEDKYFYGAVFYSFSVLVACFSWESLSNAPVSLFTFLTQIPYDYAYSLFGHS